MASAPPFCGLCGSTECTPLHDFAKGVERHRDEMVKSRATLIRQLRQLTEAAGCPDEENFESIVERVKSLHDAVLGSHRVLVHPYGGADTCGDCDGDIEDLIQAGEICVGKSRT